MKIVVLDGYTLNPGDLSWTALEQLGSVKVYERTPEDKIVERSGDADILFSNKVQLNADTLRKLPNLKYIGVLATGYDIIDLDYARQNGIVVTNVPEYGTASVAQMTFALLLSLCAHVQKHSDRVMEGKWSRSLDFCFWDFPLTELSGKTFGIIGFGTIGRNVADIATAFGMNILAYSRSHTNQDNRVNFRWVDLHELLRESDVISIHCPLNSDTRELINRRTLKLMKKTAYLINTSRGGIINDRDLTEALDYGCIAGAGLDVLSTEPPTDGNPLFTAKNCLITPHIAWATKEARQRLMDTAVNNLNKYLAGEPVNIVN